MLAPGHNDAEDTDDYNRVIAKIGLWDLSLLENLGHTTLTSYNFMYIYTYIHAYIQTQACLSIYIYTNTHPHVCLDTCIHVYIHACPDRESYLSTYKYTYIHDLIISSFLYIWNFHIFENQKIWILQKYRKKWNNGCLCVCMCVCMYIWPKNLCHYICLCEHNSEGDGTLRRI